MSMNNPSIPDRAAYLVAKVMEAQQDIDNLRAIEGNSFSGSLKLLLCEATNTAATGMVNATNIAEKIAELARNMREDIAMRAKP